MAGTNFRISTVRWGGAEDEIRPIRETVFMSEQNVPEGLEWDGLDPDCDHVLVYDVRGNPIGTGRLTEDGWIGRMAVLKEWRGRGVGDLLLTALLQIAREKDVLRVRLAAQVYAIGFYERHGFIPIGGIYDDAGIPHREMYLDL